MNTVKTTITIKPTVLAQLKSFVKRNNFTMSQVFEAGVIKVMEETEQGRSGKVWSELSKLKGVGKADPSLNDQSVDEILYGGSRGLE